VLIGTVLLPSTYHAVSVLRLHKNYTEGVTCKQALAVLFVCQPPQLPRCVAVLVCTAGTTFMQIRTKSPRSALNSC
jgi:hypothetical protein